MKSGSYLSPRCKEPASSLSSLFEGDKAVAFAPNDQSHLSLRDSYPSWSEEFFTPPIASLHLLCHRAWCILITLCRPHGFVELRVKSLTQSLKWSDAVRFEQSQELPVKRLQSLRHR
jgi:hypothetical protein